MSNTTAPATVPCANYFTTAKGEHWCSVEVGTEHAHNAYAAGRTTAHEGPCVEISVRYGAVENTVWAAMRSNAHLLRPADELAVDQDALRAEALVLDQTREIQRWTSDTPPSKPTDWEAVAEYATKRVHFTEDEWAHIAQVAADGNTVAKAEEAGRAS